MFSSKTELWPTGPADFLHKNKGSVMVLVSQAVAVLLHVAAKFLETTDGQMEPLQILSSRMVVTVTTSSLILWARKEKEFPLGPRNLRVLFIVRAIGGICGSIGFYYSLIYLPLAEATILNFLAPLGAGILTAMIGYGSFGVAEQCATGISLLGVGLIAKPKFLANLFHSNSYVSLDEVERMTRTNWQKGVAFAVMGAVGGACAYSTIEIIGPRAHPLTVTNYFGVGIIIISSICFLIVPGVDFDVSIDWVQWALLGFIGVCGVIMEYLLTAGLAMEQSPHAKYMIYSQAVLALLMDGIVWHKAPDAISCAGALFVMTGLGVVVTLGNHPTYRPVIDMDDDQSMIRIPTR